MNADLRKRLMNQLIVDEELRLDMYPDSEGKLTVGVGRNIEDKGISKAEAMFMFNNDVDDTFDDLDRACPWWTEMPAAAREALANMCFNLGLPRLLSFRKMLACLRNRDYLGAAREAVDSRWASQVGDRAKRIEDAYRRAHIAAYGDAA